MLGLLGQFTNINIANLLDPLFPAPFHVCRNNLIIFRQQPKTSDLKTEAIYLYLENDFMHGNCNYKNPLLLSGIPQLWW